MEGQLVMHTIETTATVAADGSATIDEPLDQGS